MNMQLRLAIFTLVATSLTACFLVPQEAVDAVKDQIPQVENTLRIDALADGSGRTRMIACVSDPVVCVNADGPFAASIGGAAAANLNFVVDYKEADGKEIGRFQGELSMDTPDAEIAVTRAGNADTKSVVTLPEPAMITAPTDAAAFSAATDTIQLTWDSKAGTDPMEWSATVECAMPPAFEVIATKIDDTGEVVIDPAKLNLKAGETCNVTLHLSRWRDGTIEKAFAGKGLITAKQTRSVKITVAP